MKKIIYILYFFLLSCGARKVEKTQSKVTAESQKQTETKSKDSLSIAVAEIKTENKNVSETKTETETNLVFTPIDSTKAIEINDNGKIYKIKNAVIKKQNRHIDNAKTDKSIVAAEKNTNVEQTKKGDKKELDRYISTSTTTTNNTDRKSIIDVFWLIIILAICIACILYSNGKKTQ